MAASLDPIRESEMKCCDYQPLPNRHSIRLIDFEVTNDPGVIRCSLVTKDLREDPPYAALSYTWGDPLAVPYRATAPSKYIWCNNQPHAVTENLYEALRRIAGFKIYPQTSSDVAGSVNAPKLLLWVDGICINQHDLAERSVQVAMMGEIYAKAALVTTWLGRHDENSSLAFEVMDRALPPIIKKWEDQGKGRFSYSYNSSSLFESLGISPITETEWKALESFFERQYFYRCWVVQEVSLARAVIVICGDHFREWEPLVAVSEFLTSSGWQPILQANTDSGKQSELGVLAKLADIRQKWDRLTHSHEDESESSLNQLQADHGYTLLEHSLLATIFCNATDPRDKIFATTSMVSEMCRSKGLEIRFPQPNYSMSIRDVFVNASREIITSTGRISVLSMVGDKTQCKISDLPSWVPDFTSLPSTLAAFAYTALKGTLSCCISTSADVLELNGVLCDVIDEVETSEDDVLEPWLRMCLKLDEVYFNGQHRVEVLWRTLIGDFDGKYSPAPIGVGLEFRDFLLVRLGKRVGRAVQNELYSFEGLKKAVDSFERLSNEKAFTIESTVWTDYDDLERGQTQFLPTRSEVTAFVESSLSTVRQEKNKGQISSWEQKAHGFASAWTIGRALGKPLFHTAKDLLGLGLDTAKPGDSVWFFPTSGVPFILRRLAGDQYQLIGEAYLHGYMHGELNDQDLEFQRISLV